MTELPSLPLPDVFHVRPIAPGEIALCLLAVSRKCKRNALQKAVSRITDDGFDASDLLTRGWAQEERGEFRLSIQGQRCIRDMLPDPVGDDRASILKYGLPAHALGLHATASMIARLRRSPSALPSAILACVFDLAKEIDPLDANQVRSGLVWLVVRARLDDIVKGKSPQANKLDPVSMRVFKGFAGVDRGNVQQATSSLAARVLGAASASADDLRAALMRLAVRRHGQSWPQAPVQVSGDFIEQVLRIARAVHTPPFDDRVAIAQVYDAWAGNGHASTTLTDFKRKLLEAARRKEVVLTRLDLPDMLPDELRRRSAIEAFGGQVHFIARKV